MEDSESNNCNIRCCECDSSFCQYHCAFPPIFLDNVYNRFRQPCLAIICILIMLVFGSQNIYGLTLLTCDQMYIVDPTCYQSDPFTVNQTQYTMTVLSKQNNIDYQISDAWKIDNNNLENNQFNRLNQYQITTIIDKIFTVILCIGNSPYHSPLWLLIGFAGTSYSTFKYTESIQYCGNHCKTFQNERYNIPEQCHTFKKNGMCQINDELCNKCQCENAANDSCMTYVNNQQTLNNIRILISAIWFIISYFRQTLTISLLLKILFRFICRRKHEDYTIFHCFDCLKCCKVFSKKRSKKLLLNQEDKQSMYSNSSSTSLKNELSLIPIKQQNNENKYSYGNIKNNAYMYTKNTWYNNLCNIFKEFINPLSVRVSVGSIICIIFLIVSFYTWFAAIGSLLADSIFVHYKTVKWIIILLLLTDGICCAFIDLRCIYIIHRRFQSDVVAVYKFYNAHSSNANDDEASEIDHIMKESIDSMPLFGYYEKEKTKQCCWNPLKTLFKTLFPAHIHCGETIVENVKQCRIMNAYQFVFVYPLSITVGCNVLFMIVLIPIIIVIIILYFIILGNWTALFDFLIQLFQWLSRLIWPIIALKIFDYCILRGNTNKILMKRNIKCFWFITLIDAITTFFSALFMSVYSVFFVRIGYSILIISIGLLTPYLSTLPKPWEINDSVYHSYCSNVALTALSLLKSNEKKTFSDVAKQCKIEMLLQRNDSFQNKIENE